MARRFLKVLSTVETEEQRRAVRQLLPALSTAAGQLGPVAAAELSAFMLEGNAGTFDKKAHALEAAFALEDELEAATAGAISTTSSAATSPVLSAPAPALPAPTEAAPPAPAAVPPVSPCGGTGLVDGRLCPVCNGQPSTNAVCSAPATSAATPPAASASDGNEAPATPVDAKPSDGSAAAETPATPAAPVNQ